MKGVMSNSAASRLSVDEPASQPFKLDSATPTIPVRDFVESETRYAILQRTDPARARELAELLQADVDERWRYYEQLAEMERTIPHVDHHDAVEELADTSADPGREG